MITLAGHCRAGRLVLDLPRFEQALHQFAAGLRLDLAAFTADHISALSSERHCRTLARG